MCPWQQLHCDQRSRRHTWMKQLLYMCNQLFRCFETEPRSECVHDKNEYMMYVCFPHGQIALLINLVILTGSKYIVIPKI